MLIDGKWTADWQPVQATDAKRGFVRQTSSFRNWVTPTAARGRAVIAALGPSRVAIIFTWRPSVRGPRAR